MCFGQEVPYTQEGSMKCMNTLGRLRLSLVASTSALALMLSASPMVPDVHGALKGTAAFAASASAHSDSHSTAGGGGAATSSHSDATGSGTGASASAGGGAPAHNDARAGKTPRASPTSHATANS